MRYIRIAQTNEVPDGTKKKVELEGKTLLLVNVNGTYFALDNRCPHMGGSLYDGNLDGDVITCPRHGASFNVKTGKAQKPAKVAFFSVKVNDATPYPVKLEDDVILAGIE